MGGQDKRRCGIYLDLLSWHYYNKKSASSCCCPGCKRGLDYPWDSSQLLNFTIAPLPYRTNWKPLPSIMSINLVLLTVPSPFSVRSSGIPPIHTTCRFHSGCIESYFRAIGGERGREESRSRAEAFNDSYTSGDLLTETHFARRTYNDGRRKVWSTW